VHHLGERLKLLQLGATLQGGWVLDKHGDGSRNSLARGISPRAHTGARRRREALRAGLLPYSVEQGRGGRWGELVNSNESYTPT
jgi:hypothetical protein